MLSIEPLLFCYKTDDDSIPLQLGYKAQDLLRAGLPHCITFHKSDGLAVQDPETYIEGISYSVEYSKMACLLHKLVLRQQKEIEILVKDRVDVHARLDDLRSKLNELKAVISG